MDEPATRPTTHVLRPHHIFLLAVLRVAFRDHESKLPDPFVLHLYRVLLHEIAEIAEPKPFQELVQIISAGPKAETAEPQRVIAALRESHREIQSLDQILDFFARLRPLFVEKGDDDDDSLDPPTFAPRSLFHFFCRRCFVTYLKISSPGLVQLQKDYQAWCEGDIHAGYGRAVKDEWNNDGVLIFRTSADKKTWAQTEPFSMWEKGYATGDENVATENLRRFFEQHFHESNDSGYRQHALLNLVRMHYVREEFVAARKLLKEAITVARTNGDKVTLQHCISMLHRMPPTESGRRQPLNDIQSDLHPLEILFDVKKLMHIPHEQPLSASFEKIIQALGVYDHWIESQRTRLQSPDDAVGLDADQWAFHTIQAIVWNAVGCGALATVEQNIVTAFTDIGRDDNNRLTATLNRAYKRARQGHYTQALAALLEPNVWQGLSSANYLLWANQIWHIFVLRASRRGQRRLASEFLEPHQPPGSYYEREYWFNSPGDQAPMIQDPLYEVMELRQCEQATSAVNQLLTALWHSEFLGRLGYYRTGIIFLADLGLEFGMTRQSRRILEEIMPQIMNGDDIEQRALACFVLAMCIIASPDEAGKDAALRQALHFLQQSEKDYRTLQHLRPLADVQYIISVIYHNLGMDDEKEAAAARHHRTEEERGKLEMVVFDEEINEVWRAVVDIGIALARR